MFGLYFADAGQHIEHRLFVDHNEPQTHSNVDYKGALQGEGAHTVWVGDVLIRKVAEGIDTYELNRNLVLTDGARADSVPNLEIETGEIVGAGHASTTGPLRRRAAVLPAGRGIPEDEARRLVVHGFFADIIRRIGVPELERLLRGRGRARGRCWPRVGGVHGRYRVPARRRGRLGQLDPRRGRRRRRRRRWRRTTRSSPSTTSARTPPSRSREGDVEGGAIECWLHGSRFDLRTGKPDRPPGHHAGQRLSRKH